MSDVAVLPVALHAGAGQAVIFISETVSVAPEPELLTTQQIDHSFSAAMRAQNEDATLVMGEPLPLARQGAALQGGMHHPTTLPKVGEPPRGSSYTVQSEVVEHHMQPDLTDFTSTYHRNTTQHRFTHTTQDCSTARANNDGTIVETYARDERITQESVLIDSNLMRDESSVADAVDDVELVVSRKQESNMTKHSNPSQPLSVESPGDGSARHIFRKTDTSQITNDKRTNKISTVAETTVEGVITEAPQHQTSTSCLGMFQTITTTRRETAFTETTRRESAVRRSVPQQPSSTDPLPSPSAPSQNSDAAVPPTDTTPTTGNPPAEPTTLDPNGMGNAAGGNEPPLSASDSPPPPPPPEQATADQPAPPAFSTEKTYGAVTTRACIHHSNPLLEATTTISFDETASTGSETQKSTTSYRPGYAVHAALKQGLVLILNRSLEKVPKWLYRKLLVSKRAKEEEMLITGKDVRDVAFGSVVAGAAAIVQRIATTAFKGRMTYFGASAHTLAGSAAAGAFSALASEFRALLAGSDGSSAQRKTRRQLARDGALRVVYRTVQSAASAAVVANQSDGAAASLNASLIALSVVGSAMSNGVDCYAGLLDGHEAVRRTLCDGASAAAATAASSWATTVTSNKQIAALAGAVVGGWAAGKTVSVGYEWCFGSFAVRKMAALEKELGFPPKVSKAEAERIIRRKGLTLHPDRGYDGKDFTTLYERYAEYCSLRTDWATKESRTFLENLEHAWNTLVSMLGLQRQTCPLLEGKFLSSLRVVNHDAEREEHLVRHLSDGKHDIQHNLRFGTSLPARYLVAEFTKFRQNAATSFAFKWDARGELIVKPIVDPTKKPLLSAHLVRGGDRTMYEDREDVVLSANMYNGDEEAEGLFVLFSC